MLSAEEIRNYWEGRAAGDLSAQSTTQDIYLREIELRTLVERIEKFSPASVGDVGCGDGRTTIGVSKRFSGINFSGFDYASSMIENARKNAVVQSVGNIIFGCHDIINPLGNQFDLIYTTRCLINLPSWDLQRIALRNIWGALKNGGRYLMIENFVEGQENFNKIRRDFGLPEISVRNHNLFFQRSRLLADIDDMFEIHEEVNISSTYYLVSRVVYSSICAAEGVQPDYFDAHHRYAANLPFTGEFGPIRLLVLKKK